MDNTLVPYFLKGQEKVRESKKYFVNCKGK